MLNNFLLIVFVIVSELLIKSQYFCFHWWWDWNFSINFIMAPVNFHSSFGTCLLLDFLLFVVVPRILSLLEVQQVLPSLQFPWLWYSLTFLNIKKSKNFLNCEMIYFCLISCSFFQTLQILSAFLNQLWVSCLSSSTQLSISSNHGSAVFLLL